MLRVEAGLKANITDYVALQILSEGLDGIGRNPDGFTDEVCR